MVENEPTDPTTAITNVTQALSLADELLTSDALAKVTETDKVWSSLATLPWPRSSISSHRPVPPAAGASCGPAPSPSTPNPSSPVVTMTGLQWPPGVTTRY